MVDKDFVAVELSNANAKLNNINNAKAYLSDAFYDLDFLGQVHYQLTWTDIQIQCFNIKIFLFYLLRREQTLCLLGVLLHDGKYSNTIPTIPKFPKRHITTKNKN
jgi:hypothetical protein